ncbi:Mis12-Mtw1 protein family-domain-containing protein [Mortierella sp. GBAus27b]|nr:Mis12-Mtw1 protein family-domain-containing protein [Mortierella sp. GBAus27b]
MRVPAAKTQGARQPKQAPSQHLRHQQQQQHTPTGNQESFVTIPMRETPTIQRNKDLRSVSRRSSFNMRGKRASSIGNGFAALPHPSVDPKSFFRHIAADGPPPVRMKQLMSWCARKCIDSQKSSSKDALAIAKKIEEEALDMLIGGKFSVSWYSRPPDTEAASKKPHHQNVENQIKLKECETMVAKLKREDEEWTRIISSFNTFHATLLDSGAILPSADEGIVVSETFADNIEVELLSADERSLLEKHCKHKDAAETDSGSTSKTPRDASDSTNRSAKDDNKWMKDMINSLEKEVDDLHDTLYAASRFDKIARQYTDQVLEQVAFALDERQRPSLQDNPLMLLPSSSSSSAPPSSLTSSSSGSASKGKGSSLKPASPTTSTSASIGSIPSIGSDSADDPRQILRALSRLSL